MRAWLELLTSTKDGTVVVLVGIVFLFIAFGIGVGVHERRAGRPPR